MRRRFISTLTLMAVAAVVTSAAAASASTTPAGSSAASGASSPKPDLLPPGGSECIDGDGGLCLYYLANGSGARVETFYEVSCYDNCGGTNYYFDDTADGTAGAGDAVRNATHYVYNNSSTVGYDVFVSPNYGGAADVFCPDGTACELPSSGEWWYTSYGNLVYTLNNDASQDDFAPLNIER
jgi:hypothetical protein